MYDTIKLIVYLNKVGKIMKKYYIYTADMNKVSLFCALIISIMILVTDIICPGIKYDSVLILLFIFPYFFLHEIFHSLAYVLHGADFNKITYGIHIEKGVLVCLCKQNISKKCILISLVYPFIFLGIIAYIIGIVINNNVLLMLSICNLAGCASDLILFMNFIKLKDFEYTECDNPMNIAIYTKEDVSKKKMFGLKFIESSSSIKREDYKKIDISKVSKILLLVYLTVTAIILILRGLNIL